MAKQHSSGLQPWVASNQKPRPERATESLICPDVVEQGIESDISANVTATPTLAALSASPTRYAVQFGLRAVLPHSNTPSPRVAGFEDEDDDEDSLPDEACGL
jgi:hypothetical protein